ncbi:TPA: hypothetical protein ACNUWH_002581 [Aeromonas salmonicida subsp. salmonicida]|uniref:hypothetical protein n=1 Tax=Aeromonas salmonicida TaxID=645 RepID=UPI001F2A7903|nr:hypothetical protein [Aeromonas salmonicida]
MLDRILHPLRFAAIGGALQLAQGADDLLEIAALEVADAALDGLLEQLLPLASSGLPSVCWGDAGRLR